MIRWERSPEPCAEAGWVGWDGNTEAPLDEAFIRRAAALGRLLYLDNLRQPFFRITGENFFIRGCVGQRTMRLGVQGGSPAVFAAVTAQLESAFPSQ